MSVDVLVIGGGPAGLASACAAHDEGAKVFLIEREEKLGGILKQCIHDGFGLTYFHEKLSGPEYAYRWIDMFEERNIPYLTNAFVIRIEKKEKTFEVTYVTSEGVKSLETKTIILSTGCRERTAKQVQIHGTRPAGVFTAGSAQHFINLLGQNVGKECVILGSGDIGLIMARRLTLEGAHVIGVYEAKSTPSGLTRNIHQCLFDYNIPLYLSHTVTRCFGHDRLEAVEICEVDEHMQPIASTAQKIPCDTLILSVGLIPENELAESLGVEIDPHTKGPLVDETLMSTVEGVFSCGNALHVNDLVDYVSESGEIAGKGAVNYIRQETSLKYVPVKCGKGVGYVVPQRLHLTSTTKTTFYFRSKQAHDTSTLRIYRNDEIIYEKRLNYVKPPEMEKLVLDIKKFDLRQNDILTMEIHA